jgi:hypothetical protein
MLLQSSSRCAPESFRCVFKLDGFVGIRQTLGPVHVAVLVVAIAPIGHV